MKPQSLIFQENGRLLAAMNVKIFSDTARIATGRGAALAMTNDSAAQQQRLQLPALQGGLGGVGHLGEVGHQGGGLLSGSSWPKGTK